MVEQQINLMTPVKQINLVTGRIGKKTSIPLILIRAPSKVSKGGGWGNEFLTQILRIEIYTIFWMSVCLSVHICDILLILHLSPLYDVPDHANHIFSESLSSGDDNDRDEDLQKDKYKEKDTQTPTKTNTKCFQDLMYAIFIKYYIDCLLVMTKTKTNRQRQIQSSSKTQCMLFFQKQGVQGFKILYWLSSCDDKDKDKILGIFRGEYFSGGKDFLGMNMFRR